MIKRIVVAMAVMTSMSACVHAPAVSRSDLLRVGEGMARSICAGTDPVVEEVPNRHDSGRIDRVETRRCASGSSQLYFPGSSAEGAGFVVAISVSEAGQGLPEGIEIGTSVDQVLGLLGEPDAREANALSYELSAEVTNTLTIQVSNGVVSSVSWSYYLD